MYNVLRKLRDKLTAGSYTVTDYYQPAEVVLENAKSFIQGNRDKDNRYFLVVHLMEPHDPYFEHPYLRGEGDAEFNGVGFARAEVEHPKPEQAEYLKEVYSQEIIHMDKRIADFFQWMKDEGLYEETWIAFTSDHGEEFNEHGGWWHGTTLYEEQIHVPLIVKLPGNELAGTRIPYSVQQFDACSTAVAAQGLPLHETWDGQDLMPNVREWIADSEGAVGDTEPEDVVEGEAVEQVAQVVDPCAERLHPFGRATLAEIDFEGNVVTAIRDDGYKVIQANEGNPRGLPTRVLYDLDADPGEMEDISGKSGQQCQEYYADIADRLQKELGDTLVAVKSGGASGDVGCVSDAEIQNLIALGYLDGDAAAELRAKCN
jgi:arylsulfatase A-like enzyme